MLNICNMLIVLVNCARAHFHAANKMTVIDLELVSNICIVGLMQILHCLLATLPWLHLDSEQ